VAKRCKIGFRLILIVNKKLYTGFQMTYKSLTLDDPEGSYARFPTKTGHISETVRNTA